MKKRLQKRFIIGVIIILALLVAPSAVKIFQLYVYDPSPEPRPEDFYVRMDDPLFTGLAPAPVEDVEISKTDGGKLFVDAKKDGYTLTLPPELDVYTREMEEGLVYISNKDGCNVIVVKSVGENVMEQFEKQKKEYESDTWSEVIRYEIEPLEDESMEVYIETYEHEAFGVQHSIYIQGNNEAFFIGQSGMPYPECSLLTDVFDGFNFRNQ